MKLERERKRERERERERETKLTKLQVQKHFIKNNMHCKSFLHTFFVIFFYYFRKADDSHVYSGLK